MINKTRTLGQYHTATWVAELLFERYFSHLDSSDIVIEPTCGDGRFLEVIPSGITAVGVDIDPVMAAKAAQRTGRRVLVGDFRTVPLQGIEPTAIIGNPPFSLSLIDGFLDRSHELLPEHGVVGFLLPCYAFQTAARVVQYSQKWSIKYEMIPRNLFTNLSKPLVFAVFRKDRKHALFGFALYHEAASVQKLPPEIRSILSGEKGAIWRALVSHALQSLGGSGTLGDIYKAIEGCRPATARFWREKIRQTLQRHEDRFTKVDRGVWALAL